MFTTSKENQIKTVVGFYRLVDLFVPFAFPKGYKSAFCLSSNNP